MDAAFAAHAAKFKETFSAVPLRGKANTTAILTDGPHSRLKQLRAGAEGKH